MKISPKVIALTAVGVLLVGGAAVAAPMLGDSFTASVAPPPAAAGGPVEFAVNANGETYGSPLNEQVPDLMLTRAEGGKIGYVRVSELNHARNLRKSSTNPNRVFDIPVYLSDGETKIGVFRVLDDTENPRDRSN
ncbi:MAG: hypothetical protein ACXIUP_10070 [Microcella sp.]